MTTIKETLEYWAIITSSVIDGHEKKHFPVSYQLKRFGISNQDLIGLRGKKTLDIGCGKRASFVHFLKRRGIEAEGIDSEVKREEDYLMRQMIFGQDRKGRIPRPDRNYDLVTACSIPPLNAGLTSVSDYYRAKWINECYDTETTEFYLMGESIGATLILFEGLRVLKPEGRFIIHPALTRLDETILYGAGGNWLYRHEACPIHHTNSIIRDCERLNINPEIVLRPLSHRTVIYQDGNQPVSR